MSTNEKGKLGIGTKIAYSVGSLSRTTDNLMGSYFIFFLTTVVAVSPRAAGNMMSVMLILGGIFSPIVGYLSDKSRSKFGKRRFFMLIFMIPCAATLFLSFLSVDFGVGGNIAYYAIVGTLAYICYYGYVVPYDSFGGEITEDYNDRSLIRSLCTAVMWISVVIGSSFLMWMVGIFTGNGMDDNKAWMIAVGLISIVMLIGSFLAFAATKGKDPAVTGDIKAEFTFISSYIEVLKVKVTRHMVVWSVFYFISTAVFASTQAYYVIYVQGLTEIDMGYLATLLVVFSLIALPIVTAVSKRIGKKPTLVLFSILFIIGLMGLRIIEPSGFGAGVALMGVYGLCNSSIFTISYAMLYDSGEVNEYRFGDNKIAAVMGAFVFAMTIALAVGYALTGNLLAMGGFDANAVEQSENAITWMTNLATVVPSIAIALSLIPIVGYKINERNHGALLAAIEAKKEGKEVDEAEFKEILR